MPNKTELHSIWFDPGGIMGWSYAVVSSKAFANPHERVLKNLLEWRTGEFEGTEHDKVTQALDLIRTAMYGSNGASLRGYFAIGTEDFELTQLIGGKDLLIPVRLNAILEHQLATLFRVQILYQHRTLRTGVTREHMKLWKLPRVRGKDAFASAQHNLTFLKRVKVRADEISWEKFQVRGLK